MFALSNRYKFLRFEGGEIVSHLGFFEGIFRKHIKFTSSSKGIKYVPARGENRFKFPVAGSQHNYMGVMRVVYGLACAMNYR